MTGTSAVRHGPNPIRSAVDGLADGTRTTMLAERSGGERTAPVPFSIDPRVVDREYELVTRFEEQRRLRCPAAFVIEIPDGVVDVDHGLALDADATMVSETVHSWKALTRSGYSISQDRNQYWRAPVEIEAGGETGVLLGSQDNENRMHWILGSLPRVAVFRAAAASTGPVKFVTQELTGWQRAWLEVVGVSPDEIIETRPGKHLRFERLFVPSRGFTRIPHFSRWALNALRALPDRVAEGPSRVLILPTRKAPRVLRAAAVEAVARRLGFETVYADEGNAAYRVAMFRAAEFVLTLSGPHLAASVFSPPGCRILELAPPGLEQPVAVRAWSMADVLGQQYGCLVAHRAHETPEPSRDTLDLDLEHMYAFVADAVERAG